jgi:HD-GYP domain-containing protein (c-di-GMP phosphodiesterase class II)
LTQLPFDGKRKNDLRQRMYRKVKQEDLRIGMFVADLDRPWIDTPFLLQGFLIEDEEQLRQVIDSCQWVMIDPQRSTGMAYEPPAKPKPKVIEKREVSDELRVHITHVEAPADGTYYLSDDEQRTADANAAAGKRVSDARKAKGGNAGDNNEREWAIQMRATSEPAPVDETEAAIAAAKLRTSAPRNEGGGLRGLFGQLKESARSLFLKRDKDNIDYDLVDSDVDEAGAYIRPSFIPENVQLVIYENKLTVEEEIAFAHEAVSRTNDLLHKITEDIRAGVSLHLETVEEVIEDMVDSMVRNPDAMMWVARLREKDSSTYGHGLSVAVSLVAFGRHLGFPRLELSHLGMMGLLLDVGKIKLPKELLEKHDRLTPKEFALIKQHVQFGLDVLHQTPNIHSNVMDGVAQHHERMNGTGYPFGIIGNGISVFGRMSAIADTYAAMTQDRSYAEASSPHEALQLLSSFAGTQFHSEMVEQFIQSIGAFPVGSLVELSSGEIAVVATHNKLKRLKPKVMIITEADKTLRKFPTTKDLLYDVSEKPVYIRRGLPSNAYGIDPTEFYLQ